MSTDILVISQSCLAAVNRTPYRMLAEMGWRVRIVVPAFYANSRYAKAADAAQPGDPPLDQVPIVGTHPRLWTFKGIRKLIGEHRPAIVVLDVDPGSRLAVEVGRAQRAHGGRTACITCDNLERTIVSELRMGAGAAARAVAARMLSMLARPYVDHVFALSSASRELMRRLGFDGRCSVIPLGFDPALFHPDDAVRQRIRQELDLTDVSVAYFGRMVPEKGVHILIDALGQLRDKRWHLVLDEFKDYVHPYAQEIRTRIEQNALGDRVVYFDARHERVGEYMNAVDIVVVPSVSTPRWTEQYGRVAPEAMACGRMVVVSRCGALPELVEDGALIVPEGDATALATALRSAIDDPATRSRYGAMGHARATKHLSATQQAAQMDEVFRRWVRPSDGGAQ